MTYLVFCATSLMHCQVILSSCVELLFFLRGKTRDAWPLPADCAAVSVTQEGKNLAGTVDSPPPAVHVKSPNPRHVDVSCSIHRLCQRMRSAAADLSCGSPLTPATVSSLWALLAAYVPREHRPP